MRPLSLASTRALRLALLWLVGATIFLVACGSSSSPAAKSIDATYGPPSESIVLAGRNSRDENPVVSANRARQIMATTEVFPANYDAHGNKQFGLVTVSGTEAPVGDGTVAWAQVTTYSAKQAVSGGSGPPVGVPSYCPGHSHFVQLVDATTGKLSTWSDPVFTCPS